MQSSSKFWNGFLKRFFCSLSIHPCEVNERKRKGFHASKRMDASRSRKRIKSVHENVRYLSTCFVSSHIFIYIYIWKGQRNGDNYLLRLDSTFSCSRTRYSYSLKRYRASFYSSIPVEIRIFYFEHEIFCCRWMKGETWKVFKNRSAIKSDHEKM